MATKTKQWATGSGSVTIQYDGQGDGNIIITSDANSLYEARSMQITVETTNGSPKKTKTITINQDAKQRIDLSAAVVTASNQTYSGSAKTPTPTVTLNGTTIPSSGYDVAYSNNTNAGTATITITGKGDYTGVAYGTFTINKASRTLSFADSYMVLNTNSTGTKTATPSAGSGDGAITYSIANTTYATINSSTGAVTSKTSDGSVIVTATIAEGQNYLGATATYTLYVFATTHNYSYNGSYRSVTLPPGTYQFQVWGAQGGSNAAASSYGITAKAGGKGGYSVGQLTISQATGVRVYVGGQGSSSAGGYNGGGSTVGSSQYNSGDTFGCSKMGGGGGASDIRLSDGALLSRMIVAGGGGGGAMCYKSVTTSTTTRVNDSSYSSYEKYPFGTGIRALIASDIPVTGGFHYYLTGTGRMANSNDIDLVWKYYNAGASVDDVMNGTVPSVTHDIAGHNYDDTAPAGYDRLLINSYVDNAKAQSLGLENYEVFYLRGSFTLALSHDETTTTVDEYRESQVGYAGGGTTGAGYSSTYQGKQNGAGYAGSFGNGAPANYAYERYSSGAGGGGWYGGGRDFGNSDMNCVKMSGGGSGWVNTAASAGNRPSGYTGLELDSGTTYAGNTSFPAPGGGNQTGHSGNGYIRITRIS